MQKMFLIFFVLASYSAVAQHHTYVPSTAVRGAYLGSITHPGLKIGLENPYKIEEKKNRPRLLYKEQSFVFNLGLYHQKTFHTNAFFQTELQRKRQKKNGIFTDFSLGAGVSKTFLGGATYNIDTNGNFKKINMAGDLYALTSIAWAIGYNMDLKKDNKLKIYLKPSLMVLFPYNNFIHVRPTVELGVSSSLHNFWKPKVNIGKGQILKNK